MWRSDLATRFSNNMSNLLKEGGNIELLVYKLDATKDGCKVTAHKCELVGDELVMLETTGADGARVSGADI